MAEAESWEAVRERVAAMIARRDAVVEETARAWLGFARGQGWSRSDVECLWEGLTEELVRRCARDRPGELAALRDEVLAVMGALRTRILGGLEGSERP